MTVTKLKTGDYVRVRGHVGYARIDHLIQKEGIFLLDRKIGPYWTFEPQDLQQLPPEQLRSAVQLDLKAAGAESV